MALVATTMRMLNLLGVGGCAYRDKEGKPTQTTPGAASSSESLPKGSKEFKRPSVEATPSTCTPFSTPGSSFNVPSSLSLSQLSPVASTRSVSLAPGHWLLEYESLAYDLADLEMLAKFLDVTKVSSSLCGQKQATLLVKMMRFLHSLDHNCEDICCHLAHASFYFRSIYSSCGALMSPEEIANVLVLLVFLAHCHVQDETCPLKIWHRYLFKSYCKLPTLSKATMQLMKRLDYVLRVPDNDLKQSLAWLSQDTFVDTLPSEG
eukprot:TRINITY_DN27246_c0_g1_i1.p1 TRINITY_DN27246_c0_g1~~TRINITY_DN27246_c0_g1_i1.p1  ORF type:complete len:263 (-),score=43.87 TRINITY_DN27246_c0_g1_i1:300-1088(-)